MIKRFQFVLYLLGIILALCSTRIWAAPLWQTDGTIPTTTPETLRLTIEDLAIIPGTVVAGDVFDLNFRVLNHSQIPITSLSVTVRDETADWALGTTRVPKTVYRADPGRGLLADVSMGLTYNLGITGMRPIVIFMEYTYLLNDTVITAQQTETISLPLWAPTPTPTWTPTSTPIPTPSLVPSPQIIIIVTPIPQNGATPADIVESPVSASATAPPPVIPPSPTESAAPIAELPPPAADLADSARAALIVEFKDVPLLVQRGEIFTMTLVLRNATTATLSSIIATWWDDQEQVIVPIGTGTNWFLADLPPTSTQQISGQFYVTTQPPNNIGQITVVLDYLGAPTLVSNSVNIVVQAPPLPTPMPPLAASPVPVTPPIPPPVPEPSLWIRFLRFLLGGTLP